MKKVNDLTIFKCLSFYIKVKKQRTNPNEYFVPSIKTWIELGGGSDWTQVKMDRCNIQMVFDKLKEVFFGNFLKNVKCTVKWDDVGLIGNNDSYKIFDELNGYEVCVALKTLLRPRIQLISLLLHILIHMHITTISRKKIKIDHHGPEFRKLMHFFNERLETNIMTGHSFFYTPEEAFYPNQWWQCTGICLNYHPFMGIIRCATMPNEHMSFWTRHHSKCGGSFFKIFEGQRHLADGTTETIYIRNLKYMNPRGKNESEQIVAKMQTAKAAKSCQIRATIDLTEEVPKEENLCAVINLDESEFIIDDSDEENDNWVDTCKCAEVIQKCHNAMDKCFLCTDVVLEVIGEPKLALHLDTCTGYQQQVAFNPKKFI